MSSDSEDDCYGNIAQKLKSMKNRFTEDNIETYNLLDSSQQETRKKVDEVIIITETSADLPCKVLNEDSDCEEISLDTIIALNSKKKATRRSKRIADISTENIIHTSRKRSRASKIADDSAVSINFDVTEQNASDLSSVETQNVENTSVNVSSRSKARGRGRGKGRRGRYTANNTTSAVTNTTAAPITTSSVNTTSISVNTTSNSVNTPPVSSSPNLSSRSSNLRGRRRGRSNTPRRRGRQMRFPDFVSAVLSLNNPRNIDSGNYPTYSVGNTAEYPDESYNQPLFQTKITDQAKKDEEVVILKNDADLNDSLDENEELSVKVYWQSRECVKFTIRRFQKLLPIFDFFANREKVGHDKLFFTYNDKILKKDDTPDSITYSIVKFIDGGIVNQSVSTIIPDDNATAKDRVKLKFQCQNVKKPFVIYIRPEEKLHIAMMQCAENLEKPLDKLKFFFDGDLITGKNTPLELDLEGGECIDVKIIT